MKDPSNLVWLNSPPHFFWTTTISGYRVEQQDLLWNPASYSFGAYPAIIDSGTSLLFFPKSKLFQKLRLIDIAIQFMSMVLRGK